MKLFDRLLISKAREVAFPSSHVIVFDDPARGYGVATQILIPAPEFMAAGMAGGYLPEVSAYHETEYTVTLDNGTEYKNMGFHEFDDFVIELVGEGKRLKSQVITKYTVHDAPIMDAMNELECIEYLKLKDMPKRIHGDSTSNFPRYQVVQHDKLPTTRVGRNNWHMTGDINMPIEVDLDATKTEFKGKLINRYVGMQAEIENKRQFINWHEATADEVSAFDAIDMNVVLGSIMEASNISKLEAAIPAQLN